MQERLPECGAHPVRPALVKRLNVFAKAVQEALSGLEKIASRARGLSRRCCQAARQPRQTTGANVSTPS